MKAQIDWKAFHEVNSLSTTGLMRGEADTLSSFAQQYQRRGRLSPKQMNLLKRKIPSYAKQVARVADRTRLMAALSCLHCPQTADIAFSPPQLPTT